MRTTYWTQYAESSILYLSFEITAARRFMVRVTGPLGIVDYISKVMPIEEARAFWAEKLTQGWHQIDAAKAPNHTAHMAHTYGR